MEEIPWGKGIKMNTLARPALVCFSTQKSSAECNLVFCFQYDISFSPFPLFKLSSWQFMQSQHCDKRMKRKGLTAALALALGHKTWMTQLCRNVPEPAPASDHVAWHEGVRAICLVMGSVKNNVFILLLNCFRALQSLPLRIFCKIFPNSYH